MRGFKLDENGDVVIENGELVVIGGTELKSQTLQTTIGTNKGEWFFNENEGIDFDYMVGKGITEDMQRTQIQDACNQVDENLCLTEFEVETDKKHRASKIKFTAKSDENTTISLTETYGLEETNADASSKLALANETLAQYRSATTKLQRRLDGDI